MLHTKENGGIQQIWSLTGQKLNSYFALKKSLNNFAKYNQMLCLVYSIWHGWTEYRHNMSVNRSGVIDALLYNYCGKRLNTAPGYFTVNPPYWRNKVMKSTWASGAIELLKHADSHIDLNTAFDKRIAFISIDNCVETIIRTFISLPKVKSGIKVKNKSWMKLVTVFQNYCLCYSNILLKNS